MDRLNELDQILGELVEKLDSAGKVMMGNAKDIAETVKLKGEISEITKEIKNTYGEIGEYISDNYRENFREDETLVELFSRIDESNSLLKILELQIENSTGNDVIEKLDSYRKKTLNNLKTVTQITNQEEIFKKNEDEVEVIDEDVVSCSKCGSENPNYLVYCSNCGEKL